MPKAVLNFATLLRDEIAASLVDEQVDLLVFVQRGDGFARIIGGARIKQITANDGPSVGDQAAILMLEKFKNGAKHLFGYNQWKDEVGADQTKELDEGETRVGWADTGYSIGQPVCCVFVLGHYHQDAIVSCHWDAVIKA